MFRRNVNRYAIGAKYLLIMQYSKNVESRALSRMRS